MTFSRVSPLVAVILCSALAACGSDPTNGTAFAPPPGWTQTPSVLGFKMWIDPSKGGHGVVMLYKFANKGSLDFQKDVDLSNNPAFHGGSITKQADITICGNHPAKYLVAEEAAKNGKGPSDAEIVVTTWGSNAYMAMYARSEGASASPAAEAAIRTVCVKT